MLFERFLNPERVSLPDIDIDFCMNRRGEVINYVTQKYGRDQVAQIITFGTMACKAAIKDSGRAMDIPYSEVERIVKMVPPTLNITIDKALEDSPSLATAYESEPQTKELIDTAKKLEGLVRNSGVHAAGVVISPQPLTDLVPLHRTKNDEIVTAYDMKAIEKLGLLKMDFLGLTTLTIIDDALKLIVQTRGETLNLQTLALDDTETYEKVFHTGLTSGVFQFESHGMRDVLRRYKPTTVEDLTALNALYRPGPIQGGMIDDFIDRKWGRKKIEYELPELETMLKETLGVIVYQEQVMQIANRLAGYSLGEADLLRRAMGKKNADEMAKQRERFVKGAIERGFPEKKIVKIFDLMEQFAGYGFNKSHSAAYALLGVSHRLHEDALSGRIHGGAADFGFRQYRRRGEVHQRVPRDGHSGGAARRERERCQLHAARRGDSLRPLSGEERRPQCHRIHRYCAHGIGRVQVDLPVLRKGGPAAAEQARHRVAHQERRDGCHGPPLAAHGRGGHCHGTRAEVAARRCHGPARAVRGLRRRTTSRRRKSRCPILPTGTSISASRPKRKSSASSSPGIRWRSTRTSCWTSTR